MYYLKNTCIRFIKMVLVAAVIFACGTLDEDTNDIPLSTGDGCGSIACPDPNPVGDLLVEFHRTDKSYVPCLYAGGAGGFLGPMEQSGENIYRRLLAGVTGLVNLNVYDCPTAQEWIPDASGLRGDLGALSAGGRKLDCADAYDNSQGGALFTVYVNEDGSIADPGEFEPNAQPLAACTDGDDDPDEMPDACDGPGEFDIASVMARAAVTVPSAPPNSFLINRWIQAECHSGSCSFDILRIGYIVEGENEVWLPLSTTGMIEERAPLNHNCNTDAGPCGFENLAQSAYGADPETGEPIITLAVDEGYYSGIFPGDLYQAPKYFIDAGVRHTFVACARITAGSGRIRVGIDYFDFTPPATFIIRDWVNGPWSYSTDYAPLDVK